MGYSLPELRDTQHVADLFRHNVTIRKTVQFLRTHPINDISINAVTNVLKEGSDNTELEVFDFVEKCASFAKYMIELADILDGK